jgi:hypothetical protein
VTGEARARLEKYVRRAPSSVNGEVWLWRGGERGRKGGEEVGNRRGGERGRGGGRVRPAAAPPSPPRF